MWPEAERELRPFIKRFRDLLAGNLSISGTVDTINDIRYEYVEFRFSEKQRYLGLRFEMDVKETEIVEVAL